MLNLIRWIKSRDRFKTLSEILNSEEGREILIGEKKLVSLNPSSIKRDAARIVQYAKSEDYAVFLKEAYLDLIDSIDRLTNSKISSSEADFLRGRMSQTLDLMRVSYKAHRVLKEINEAKEKV